MGLLVEAMPNCVHRRCTLLATILGMIQWVAVTRENAAQHASMSLRLLCWGNAFNEAIYHASSGRWNR